MRAPTPRITVVLGLARALIDVVGPEHAAEVLVTEFGWDLAFQTLALIRDGGGGRAFGAVWTALLLDPIETDLT